MAHRTLIEQHVTVAEDAWTSSVAPAVELDRIGPALGIGDPDEPASGMRGALRRTGRALVFTLRAIGAILGILVAGLMVAILAAAQRLLHLG
ncbi:hypothetical protein [Demequina sp. NBRC 110052]|uniref:hypothetical protein n=1 Tax=Demequina sp. NBRC 110052 TaxID=1570341 RepID=UPI00117F9E74|nr:hypothetical protein [Demequina sp. NBRC 110052]